MGRAGRCLCRNPGDYLQFAYLCRAYHTAPDFAAGRSAARLIRHRDLNMHIPGYQIERELGQGGMAIVYLGLGTNLGDRPANLRAALAALADFATVEAVSRVL